MAESYLRRRANEQKRKTTPAEATPIEGQKNVSYLRQKANEQSGAVKHIKTEPPKTVTMRVDGEKMEVPQAFALAVKQTVKQKMSPVAEKMIRSTANTVANQNRFNAQSLDRLEAEGRFAVDKHETDMAVLRALEEERATKERLNLTQNGIPEFLNKEVPVDTRIAQKRKEIQDDAWIVNLAALTSLRHNADFDTLAKVGAENMDSRATGNLILDDDYGNALATEEEAKIYNYIYAKFGKARAEEYYAALKPILRERQGKNDAEWLSNINIPVVEELTTAGHGLLTGAESKLVGFGELFTGQPHETTRGEAAQRYVAENLKDKGIKIGDTSSSQLLYQGSVVVGGILPAIALSYATGGIASGLGASAEGAATASTVAGNLFNAVSAAGSARAQALAEGYTPEQAFGYGLLIGASEGALQSILGGITKLGGISNSKTMAKIQAIDNAFVKFVSKHGANLMGEVAEEELQLFLEPLFRTIILNEKYTAPEAEEIFETFLVTMLSTSAINATTSRVDNIGESIGKARAGAITGKDFMSSGMTAEDMQTIISEGLATNPDSSSYKLAEKLQRKLNKGEAVSWTEFGRLYNENLTNVDEEAEAGSGAESEGAPVPGFRKNEWSPKISNKQIRALDAIGKKLGVEITIGAPTGNTPGADNGYYENGRIVIAQDAKNPLEVVLSHEVTHRMKETAPAEYAKFVEMAVNASEKLSAVEKAELIKDYNEMYGFKGKDADTKAIDEITADYTRKLVHDVSLFRNLVNADRNVAQRFIDGIHDFIAKVKSTFSKDKSKADTASLEKYGLKVSELEEAVKTWEQMVKATETAVKRGEAAINDEARAALAKMSVDDIIDEAKTYDVEDGVEFDESLEEILAEQKNTAETEPGGERKYELKKDARQNVDKAVSRKGYNGEIELTTGSPSIITSQKGTENYPLVMKASHIRENILTEKEAQTMGLKVNKDINYHGLGKELFIEVIQDLDNVNWAYRGTKNADDPERRENYFLLISQKKDADGNVINVPVYINENAKIGKNFIEVNKVATVYGKEKLNKYISEQIQKGNLVRIKNRSINASEGSSPINDHYSKDASNKSIPDSSGKSNPQFSLKKNTDNQGRELSVEQAEYFADSKVRNNDGNLLVMYRGGNEDFTVFDRKKSKYSNLYGRGFYFTDSESHAGQYGKVREYYLNIKNPVSTTEKTITREQVRAFLEAVAGNEDDYSFENYGYGATVDGVLDSVYGGKSDFNIIYDISQTAIGDMVEAVELFNEINGTMFDGLILDTETVTFNSNQAKSVNNKTPTGNPDIRYSLKTPDLLSREYWQKKKEAAAKAEVPPEVPSEVPPEVPSEVVVSKTEISAPKTVTETRAAEPDKEMTPADELVAEANKREAEARGYKDSYLDETGFIDYANDQEDKALQDMTKLIDKKNLNQYYGVLENQAQIFADEQSGGEDKRIKEANEMLLTPSGLKKESKREQIERSADWLARKVSDSAATVRKIGKRAKDDHLYAIYNRARNGTNIAAHMIKNAQTDFWGRKVGDSLVDIITPIKENGEEYWRDFQLYLLHKHNVSRMSIHNPAEAKKAKEQFTRYVNEHPDIAAMSEQDIKRYAKDDDKRGMAVKMYVELKKALAKAEEK